VRMEIGAATETVQVEANASIVETASATIRGTISGSQIQEAPLNGRNVLDLALSTPGVIPAVAGAGNYSIGGGRGDSVTFLLDGGVNNNLLSNTVVFNPNPETVEEFTVLNSNYNAEYGRNAGGIISVVTKSGTNQFHGSFYDYVRNDYFNANLFFNNANGLPTPILKRNQFGTAIGGPVYIPKVFHGRDKLFFFSAYQGQRLAQLQQTSKITLFTPAELSGDFSRSNAAGTGPDTNVAAFLTAHPYFQPNPALASQGIIDSSKFNSVAKNYIKAGLVPSSPNGFLISQASAQTNNDELTNKVDYLPTQNDRITVTLGTRRQTSLNPFATANVPGFPNYTYNHQYYGNIDYTKTISANLINDARFNAQRNNSLQSVPGVNLPGPQQLGIGITPDVPTGPSIMVLSSGLTMGFSPQGPSALIDNTYTFQDTLTWTHSTHAIKAGFSYSPYQDNQVFDFYINGQFRFSGSTGAGSKNDRADFLMGIPNQFQQFPAAPSNIRTHNLAGFVQDEWRVRPNLRLTFGLRYEYSSPKLDLQGRTFSAILGAKSSVFTNAPVGMAFPGDSSAPRGANYPDKNDWAPRFGFAWDPKGNGKMSIRGGFGVQYDILKAEDNFQFNGQSPFFGSANFNFPTITATTNVASEVNYMTAPYTAVGQVNPFPSTPPAKTVAIPTVGGSGVYFVDPHLRTPYIYQYNLSVQRELMKNTTLEIDYIGSNSHKLTGLVDVNPFILPASGAPTTRVFNAQPGIVIDPKIGYVFSYLNEFSNVGRANYNSIVIGLTQRLTKIGPLGSMAMQLNYTHGKSLDNESGFRSTTSNVPYYNQRLFHAVSDYDLPNYFNFQGSWNLPFDKISSHGKRILSGWTLYPIVTYRSGQALNVRSGITSGAAIPGPSGAGDPGLVQANLLAPLTFFDGHTVQKAGNNRTGNFYFEPTAIAAPANDPTLRTYGSLGRNAFRGPDRTNLDISISKKTNISREGRVAIEIIGNAFNVLNHTEFANPTTSVTSSTFGQISTTADPRILQLAARLTF
ncbi:MAG TPA: TonB-dependent receptor plug domain-containing protein, partial [Candidatus Solibacter sp.]|nr:TonB-dependent receptor plug domain-containing protein [Candidatus Solibacter sp.]